MFRIYLNDYDRILYKLSINKWQIKEVNYILNLLFSFLNQNKLN